MKIEHEAETGGSGGACSWKNGDMEKKMEHELETCFKQGFISEGLIGNIEVSGSLYKCRIGYLQQTSK